MAKLYEWMKTTTEEGKEIVFGFDERGHLYIDGARVVTDLSFQWWLNFFVVLGALGAFAQGAVAVIGLVRSLG